MVWSSVGKTTALRSDPAALGVCGTWTVAALISVVNEVAHRIGLQRVIIGLMILSAALGIVLGALANAAYWLVAICFAIGAFIAAASDAPRGHGPGRGAAVSGHDDVALRDHRFTGAFIGLVLFGAALDSPVATRCRVPGSPFGAISLLVLFGPLVLGAPIGMEQIYR